MIKDINKSIAFKQSKDQTAALKFTKELAIQPKAFVQIKEGETRLSPDGVLYSQQFLQSSVVYNFEVGQVLP